MSAPQMGMLFARINDLEKRVGALERPATAEDYQKDLEAAAKRHRARLVSGTPVVYCQKHKAVVIPRPHMEPQYSAGDGPFVYIMFQDGKHFGAYAHNLEVV